MPNLRCPYCRKTFGPEPATHCPHCGRVSVVPAAMRKTTFRERQRMREKIARDAEHRRRQIISADPRFGRSPAMLWLAIVTLVVLGALLVGRANRITPAEGQWISREARATRELEVLRIALERFHEDTGRYPTGAEGLKALVLNPGVPGWDRNYVNVIKPDPWRTPYRYTLTPEGPQVRSSGPDRKPSTVDDIMVP